MSQEDKDPTTSQDDFGNRNTLRSSNWASIIVIAIIAVIVGGAFYLNR
jgi:hypothetical protein